MKRINKILVPIDFSKCTQPALERAGAVANAFGAELHVLHVAEERHDYQHYGLSPQTIADLERSASEEVEQQMQRATAELGRAATVHTRTGLAHAQIGAVAAECGVDLIVMGTRGRRGVNKLMLGSTTERLVRTAPCPVLTVRAH